MLTRAFAALIVLCALLLLLIQASTPHPISLSWGTSPNLQIYTTTLTIATVALLALLVALFCLCYTLLYLSLVPEKLARHRQQKKLEVHTQATLILLTHLALNQPLKPNKLHSLLTQLLPENPLTPFLHLQLGKTTHEELETLATHPILGTLAREKQTLQKLLPTE